jgi:hypothetical protein
LLPTLFYRAESGSREKLLYKRLDTNGMRGQGSLEYLIIAAAVLAIGAVVVVVVNSVFFAPKTSADVNKDKYLASVAGIEIQDYATPYDGTAATAPKTMIYKGVVYTGPSATSYPLPPDASAVATFSNGKQLAVGPQALFLESNSYYVYSAKGLGFVKNQGFEAEFDQWTKSCTTCPIEYVSGRGATVKFAQTGSPYVQQQFGSSAEPLTPSKTYRLCMDVNYTAVKSSCGAGWYGILTFVWWVSPAGSITSTPTTGTQWPDLGILTCNMPGGTALTSASGATADWNTYCRTMTVPDSGWVGLRVRPGAAAITAGNIWIDNVKLTEA